MLCNGSIIQVHVGYVPLNDMLHAISLTIFMLIYMCFTQGGKNLQSNYLLYT